MIPLQAWLPDELMQAIAAENNLSETAFSFARRTGPSHPLVLAAHRNRFLWHATLASAFVLLEQGWPRAADLRSRRCVANPCSGVLTGCWK